MFNPEDRAGFDQTWSQAVNDYHSSTGGMISGFVTKHNPDGSVTVLSASSGAELVIGGVRKIAGGVVGPGTGQIDVPGIGTEVKLTNNQTRSYGIAKNYTSLGNVFSSDFPHPSHPSLFDPKTKKLKLGTYGYQGGVQIGDSTTPASVQFHDTEGGYHDLTMGKRTDRRFGAIDNSADGPSVTPDDVSGIKAANGVSLTHSALAEVPVIDPESSSDLSALAQVFDKSSTNLGLSAVSMENAADSFSDTVGKQAEALAIANWAEQAGYGESEPDDLY